MSNDVMIYMHAIPDNYQINWKEPKEEFPRVSAQCFVELDRESKHPSSPFMRWCEKLSVEDGSEELPDALSLVIRLSGCYFGEDWENHYGGSSWYPHKVFISREMALEHIKDKDTPWKRYWVIPVFRFGPGRHC